MTDNKDNTTKNVYTEWAEQTFQDILDALDQIKVGQIQVLTGDNGSGKSLIRKVLCTTLRERENDNTIKVSDISMERRTGLHSELGGGGVFLRDTSWYATSSNSLGFLKSILNGITNRFVVLDEPEIGMSQDLQLSVGKFLSDKLPTILKDNKGVLIITHSKELVRNLTVEHTFINIQKKTESEWLNETAKYIELDEFEKKCSALFKLLQTKLKNAN